MDLFVNLLVSDVVRAARFYRDAVGFTVEQAMSGPDGTPVWATLRHGDARLMLETRVSFGGVAHPADSPPGKGVRIYAEIRADDDLDGRFRGCVERGATVVAEPTDQFFGARTFTVLDLDGYQLMLSQPTGGGGDYGPMTVLSGEDADRVIG